MRRIAILSLLLLLTVALCAPTLDAQNKRSFVGKRLPATGLVDMRGHKILPKDYAGAVLVVYGGIPW